MPHSNMPEVSLDVSGLTLSRKAAQLGPISFTLPHPGCWWLAGPSGAGKSLLLESLAGFHAETTGSIRIGTGTESRDVANLAPESRSITLMPQRWRLFPHWNAARNLRFAARLSATPSGRIHQLAERLQVAHLLNRPTRALSGGETQRLALIQTLLSPAKVLLLDEPLSAIDAPLRSIVLDLLLEESAQNLRICFIAAHRSTAAYPMQGALQIEKGRLAAIPKLA